MKWVKLHDWQVSLEQASRIQLELAARVAKVSEVNSPRFIAGADISAQTADGTATGAVVVLSYPGLKLVEARTVRAKLDFPYVPGLLSFRESPVILRACEQLSLNPDLILVDGQGIAHPRRMGIASHLGLLLDTPTIGCAKSKLCGTHTIPGNKVGSYTELIDHGEVIGAVLRTKLGSSPIYVSIGHKVDLKTAIYWALQCCHGYRLPEPIRLAHLAATGKLISEEKLPELGYQAKLFG